MSDTLDLAIHCEALESFGDTETDWRKAEDKWVGHKASSKCAVVKEANLFDLVNQIGAANCLNHIGQDEMAEVMRGYGWKVERDPDA